MEDRNVVAHKVVVWLALVAALLTTRCVAQEGPGEVDKWLIKIASIKVVGPAAEQLTPYGLLLADLREVSLDVALLDGANRPYTGDVDAFISGGYLSGHSQNWHPFHVKNGLLHMTFQPMSEELSSMELNVRTPGSPPQDGYWVGKPIPVVTVGRVTMTAYRRQAKPDGKDQLPIVVRAYDRQGRLLSKAPVELSYCPPANKPQLFLRGWRTGPDGVALIRLPPSSIEGIGQLQARVGHLHSNQLVVRFGNALMPPELPATKAKAAKQ